MNNENESKIDEIKKVLYSRKTGNIKSRRSILQQNNKENINKNWQKNDFLKKTKKDEDLYQYKTKKKNIFFFLILLTSITFFAASLAFAFFFLAFNKNEISLSQIDVSILGPNSVKSGDTLPFSVILDNPSDIEYEDIELTIFYPKSTIKSIDKKFINAETKTIKKKLLPGGKISEKFDVILSGATGEEKEIKLDIFYKGKNYSGVLNKKTIYKVKIESSPVNIELSYPKRVISGDEFILDVNILSNVTNNLEDLIVVGRYPTGFEVISTQPKHILSDTTKNIFKIDSIKAGEKKNIRIKGVIKGQMNEEKYFNFKIGDTIPFRNELRTIFSKSEDFLTIKKPDIGLRLVTDNDISDQEAIYNSNDKVSINLNLKNNLTSIISDIKIIGKINGNIFNKSSLNLNKGFFDSNNDKIIWDKSLNNSFKSLQPEGFITDKIDFKIDKLENIAGYIKDPKINLDFKVFANNFSDPQSNTKIMLEAKKEIKIATDLKFKEKVLYNNGPFKNTGDINPKVGMPTTYTVAWEVYNSTSDIKDIKIKAKLPIYVKYLNNVSPKESYISYNDQTREITLNYKEIKAFIGYRTDPAVVYFQIEYIPTAPHEGSRPLLIGPKKIFAKDDFTKKDIFIEHKASTTAIENDTESQYNTGIVEN